MLPNTIRLLSLSCSPILHSHSHRSSLLSALVKACFSSKFKKGVDFSKVPKINEADLEERLVRGSGPGGQAVNKTSNCVMLRHKPTGTIVKCHITRITEKNRELAREILTARLDNEINGDMSVENQRKKIMEKKRSDTDRKRRKLAEMKQKWKERESGDAQSANENNTNDNSEDTKEGEKC